MPWIFIKVRPFFFTILNRIAHLVTLLANRLYINSYLSDESLQVTVSYAPLINYILGPFVLFIAKRTCE
jgi:hypothetical protein